VSEAQARAWGERLAAALAGRFLVRWVETEREGAGGRPAGAEYPVADGAALARIGGLIDEARRLAARMETAEAARRLDEAEGAARRFRLSDSTRPLLADVFLWKGALRVWEGRDDEAQALFARSQALRPGFSPDPALFAPRVREAWDRARARGGAAAELVVSSVPSGAVVYLGAVPQGRTPVRVRVEGAEPVTLRIERPGYRPAERTGQWLPGDVEAIEVVLAPDRAAAIGEILAAESAGRAAGEAVAELATRSGAARAVVVVFEAAAGGPRVRVFSWRQGDSSLVAVGEAVAGTSEEDPSEAVAALLARAGWPAREAGGRPWYHTWWIWGLIGAALVGAAAGLGGGGGGSGSSTGTIGVSF